MRRRSRAGGKSPNAQAPKAAARKSRIAPKAVRPRSSSAAREETEVARLTRERDESLEQQTATSEVLQIISSSPGDLEPVLAAMLEKAVRICDAKFGNIYRWDGDTLHVSASYNTPPAYAEERKRAQFRADQNTSVSRMIRTKAVVHVHDLRAQASYIERNPLTVAAVELGGVRTFLAVPMLKEGDLIGAFGLSREEVRPFTDKQIELVQNFATQAVIAIENARLLNELRQRTDDLSQRTTDLTEALEQQTATSEVLRVISSSPSDLDPVFETMLMNATRLCEAKFGILTLYEGDAGFRVVAMHNAPPALAEQWQGKPVLNPGPQTASARVAATKEVIHISDYAEEAAYKLRDPGAVSVAELGGARTFLAVPMLKEKKLVGIIHIYRQEIRPFTDKQIALVQNFAAQAVIAIENARLLNELRQSLEQQTATADVLKVISSSPGALEPVFKALLENATQLCGASYGNLWLCEGDAFRSVALHGELPTTYMERWGTGALFRPEPDVQLALARAAKTKQPFQIADLRASQPYLEGNPLALSAVNDAGILAVLAVPMLKEGELVGAILIYSKEARPFTEKQIELLENFAAQAVIAIENARLLNELRQRTTDLTERTADLTEALERQTATSDVLRVISSSPGDLEPVFQIMLENAIRVCQAKFGIMFLYDGEAFRTAALHGVSPAYAEARRKKTFVVRDLHPNVPVARVARTNEVVHIADATLEQGYVERDPLWIEFVDLGGGRSLVAVPMLKENELIGAFTLYRQEVRPFTDKQIELVQNFASQAVIAIENTRLLTELRHRTDDLGRSVNELRALGEVSRAVNSTLDLETVLSTIVAKAAQLSGTEAGAIYVFDDRQRELHLRATYGMDQELIDALTQRRIGLDDPNVVQALAQSEPIQAADLRDETPNEINEITLRAGFRARLTAPLMRGEAVVGFLVVRRRAPGAFPQNTVDLIKTFAAQSAVAIENARLFQDVETSLKDLRTTQDRLVQTQKLASLGQLTAGIAHEIKNPLNFVNNFSGVSAELLDELREAVNRMTGDDKTRAEITELADTLRDNLDKIVQHGKRADAIVKNMLLHSREGSGEHRLVNVNALVEESLNLAYHGARAEKQGFKINMEKSFDPAAGEIDVYPQEITRALLNLISNGFYAATKHKEQDKSDRFEPSLMAATKNLGDKVEIRIRDNGIGIPPEVREKMFNPFFTTKPAGEGTGLGLSITHDIIVKQHSGTIEVDTSPGEFTEVRIILPRTATFITDIRGRT